MNHPSRELPVFDRKQAEGKKIREIEKVQLESAKTTVLLRRWMGTQRDLYEHEVLSRPYTGKLKDEDYRDQRGIRAFTLCLSICGQDGNLIFDAENPEDVKFVNDTFEPEEIDLLHDTVMEQNGLGKSKLTSTNGSGTTSPELS